MPDIGPFIVSAEWLDERLGTPGLSIVDASWYLPAQGRDARAEYGAAHVPGAVFFDQDAVVDPDSALPHALPDARTFARHVGAMGISADDTIVVYDGPGVFSAPRVWWMFRIMGASQVFLLDGGFDRWQAQGRPTSAEPTRVAPNVFHGELDGSKVATLEEVRRILGSGDGQVADARPAGRFEGRDPEPRPGIRGGHMPGARNLPGMTLSSGGSLLPPDELRRRFAEAGIDPSKPVVASCGSGVTAAIVSLALETLGHSGHKLYDGSWSEWGARSDTPVATGAERR